MKLKNRLLRPSLDNVGRITDISKTFLEKKGIKALIIDVDGTLLARREETIDLSIIDSNSRPIQANDSSVIFADISKLQRLYSDR